MSSFDHFLRSFIARKASEQPGTRPLPTQRDPELDARLRAAPSDRELRLVYADWLLQRGDPRGELLLLAVAGERDPVAAGRADARLYADGPGWLWPLGLDGDPVRLDVIWEAGLLSEAALWSNGAGSLAGHVAALLALPVAAALTRLRVDPGPGLGTALGARPNALRTLELTGLLARPLGDLGDAWPASPWLESLVVEGPDPRLGAPALPRLRALHVAAVDLDAAFFADLAASELPALEALSLVVPGPLAEAEALEPLVARRWPLRTLALRQAPWGDAAVELLVDSPLAAGLEALDLTGSYVSDAAEDSLRALKHRGVRRFGLDGTATSWDVRERLGRR